MLFLFLSFAVVLFWSGGYYAQAQCDNGECVPEGSCDETYNTINLSEDCGEGGVCCIANENLVDGEDSSTATVEFTNPLEYDTVEEVLTSLLNALQGVIVVISIIFIVIGAIFYITSGGSEERIKTGKKAIFAALIGLAIGIAAPTFLKEISNILGWTTDNEMVSEAPTIATIALNTLNFLLGIVGTLALIMLIVGGVMYITSATSTIGEGANEKKVSAAKKVVTYAIIGITVALAAMVIVKQIAGFFN